MFQLTKMRAWVRWPLVRSHLCTLAVSVSFGSSWRAPRLGLALGGLQAGLTLTAALALMAPLVLLQLAIGQLSQQDAVGVWKAVPFFKGVGYLRLLTSFLGCVYTMVHVALTTTYFFTTLSQSIPFQDCKAMELTADGYQNTFNASDCLSATFMAPVSQKPEYYTSMSLIIVFMWMSIPFLLYSPVKLMKRIFYVLGPVVVASGIVVASCLAAPQRLTEFYRAADWGRLTHADAWLGAVAQALVSSQVAGGYLISAGDSIYSSTNVQWTAIAIVVATAVASWGGLLFWFAVGGAGDFGGPAAVLEHMYAAADRDALPLAWPLVVFAALFLSGIITLLTHLYPVFDRLRRAGGPRWRAWGAGCAALGAGLSLAALAGREPALAAAEDIAVPLLATVATVLEVVGFVFIYGRKALTEDIEFLTGQDLSKCWVVGWHVAPAVVIPVTLWWLVELVQQGAWSQPPWSASVVATTGALTLLILVTFAVVAVARQVQYDVIGKLKSSFRASRHWGPRDPITHYYWLARREEVDRGAGPRCRYQRRRAGQLAGAPAPPAALALPSPPDLICNDAKRRSNSDDWVYTVYRRRYLEDAFAQYFHKKRSMSLDWGKLPRIKKDSMELKILDSAYLTPIESVETVFKDAISDVKNNDSV